MSAWILSRRGNTVLEAALVLPVLLLLTFGAVEYGYFLYLKHSLLGVAREGARAAVITSATNAQVQSTIDSALGVYGMQANDCTVTFSPEDLSIAAEGQNVTVTVETTWGASGVQLLHLISDTKKVRASVVMRRE